MGRNGQPRECSTCVALVAAVVLVAQTPESSASSPRGALFAPGTNQPTFDELIFRADEANIAGEYAQSARLYADAYHTLSIPQRSGSDGEFIINNALDNYLRAHELSPEDTSLLREPIALLEEFWSDRTQVDDERLAEQPQMITDLEQLRTMLDALDDEPPPALPEPPTVEPEVPPDPRADEPAQPIEPSPQPAWEPSNVSAAPDPRAGRTASWVITSTGIVSAVGGVTFIAMGAATLDLSQSRADHTLATFDGNEAQQQKYRDELSSWTRSWRRTATAEIVAGSVLAAAGIGLTTWGIWRLRSKKTRPDRRYAVLSPAITRQLPALAITGRF